MRLPKTLLPSNEKEILKEISEELNIPLHKVTETFDIWLDYIEDIVLNTDQSTVTMPRVGKMYVNFARLRHAEDKDWAQRKKDRIDREIPRNKKNHHEVTVPINCIYGVGRKNFKLGRDSYDHNYSFFTKEECIRRQNIVFFREDKEFNDRKDIFEEYFNDIPEQRRHEHYKNIKDYKKQTKKQTKIERCKMVRREKIYMQRMSRELEE